MGSDTTPPSGRRSRKVSCSRSTYGVAGESTLIVGPSQSLTVTSPTLSRRSRVARSPAVNTSSLMCCVLFARCVTWGSRGRRVWVRCGSIDPDHDAIAVGGVFEGEHRAAAALTQCLDHPVGIEHAQLREPATAD